MTNVRSISDGKTAAQKLRESEDKLKHITDSIPGAVFRFVQQEDGGQEIDFVSRGMAGLLDLDPSEKQVSFAEFLGYVIPEDEEALLKSIALASAGPSAWFLQFRVQTPGGKIKWIRGESSPEPRLQDGSIVFNGMLTDITRQMETESLLEATGRIAKIGGWEMTVATGEISITQQVRAIFELATEDEFDFATALSYYDPDGQQEISEAIERLMTSGEPWATELPIKTPSGQRLWVRAIGHAERVADKTVRLVGIFQDVTERKQVEDSLLRAKRLNEQILEMAGEGIYGADMEGRITFVNEAAAKIIGWDRTKLQGTSQHKAMRHSDSNGVPYAEESCPTCKALREGKEHRVSDETFWRKDNSNFPVDYVCTPIRDGDELVGAVVVFKDVTDARELTKKLSYQATHDSLTGLINRQDFENRLARVIDTATKRGTINVLAFLDLDKFKVVNDTCGHNAGDELLRRLPALFLQHLRERDTLARLGGDEFGIVIEHCSLEQGLRVMRRILETISNYTFVWEDHRFQFGVSIGLFEVNKEVTNLEDVMKRADAACYMAKESGRNQIQVYKAKEAE